ncbi:MAG TPA: hypothetical protein VN538_03215 [Clostridia bacterium]|nr:hypothetical protein [Clostridia bacterium]
MSLHDRFRDLESNGAVYYQGSSLRRVNLDFNDKNQCSAFITEYFKAGNKGNAFSFGFNELFSAKGKHTHTVALYFLGCLLKNLIDENFFQFLKFNIPDLNYNFYYTWFLSCLYHDTAACIEESPYQHQPLKFYLGLHNISYNVYNHRPIFALADLFTYSEPLIKNYFDYRIDYCIRVEHGILGGYLLYDRLRKNYTSAWKEHLNEYTSDKNGNTELGSYSNFKYKNLHWHIAHLDHFAIIADSIIGHNIWVNDDVVLYNHYGLDPLIKSPSNRIRIRERPVLFFLSLIDSIEPVKILEKEPNVLEPVQALQSIDFQLIGTNRIKITSLSVQHFDSYYSKVKEVEDWLDVKVGDVDNDTFIITIN